jgi:hypothetical protein
MDRNIIVIEGEPGSHKERLANQLAQEYYPQLFVEHIPFQTFARSLGHTALTSLNFTTSYDLMSKALERHDSAGLILISDYLQHVEQIEDLYELAMLDDRNLLGMIIADAPYEEKLIRIIGESKVPLTVHEARKLIVDYQQRHDGIIVELNYRDMPIEFVDTTGPETRVINNGVHAIQRLLAQDNYEDKHAS